MTLRNFINNLSERGVYHFTNSDVVNNTGSSQVAARAAIRRAREKGLVATPFQGFHVIVPPEYRTLKCLPAEQFIPELMGHLNLKYYIGLLTAANAHGISHQAPMVSQIVTAHNRAAINCGRIRVEFIARRNVDVIPTIQRNTPRGSVNISTLEATLFDLVGYPGHAGGISNIAEIVSEAAEDVDILKLEAAIVCSPLPLTQRLGYLFDQVGSPKQSLPLAKHVAKYAKEYVPLRVGRTTAGSPRDVKWKLMLNEDIETDV